jgi:hypothetical protein
MKLDVRLIGWNGMDGVVLAHNLDRWRVLTKTVTLGNS